MGLPLELVVGLKVADAPREPKYIFVFIFQKRIQALVQLNKVNATCIIET
jgi:hypothetical protein